MKTLNKDYLKDHLYEGDFKASFNYSLLEKLITAEVFSRVFPNNKEPEKWCNAFNAVFPKYSINSKERVAMFLAQYGHETNGFTRLEENLNYSAKQLANTWPNRYSATSNKPYVPNELANKLHRNPVAIANNCYANRMGNGSELSGDGWKYRGRGIPQLTGKSNYLDMSKKLFGDDRLVQNPDQVSENLEIAIAVGCEYWKSRVLNTWSDKKDIATVTRRINGGMNGFNDRKEKYNLLMKLL